MSTPHSPSASTQEEAQNLLNAHENVSDEGELTNDQNNAADSRDYTTRMDEILGDDDSEQVNEEEEPFKYAGLDAPTEDPKDYNSQLHDILGHDDEAGEREVEVELRQFDDSDEFETQVRAQSNQVSYQALKPQFCLSDCAGWLSRNRFQASFIARVTSACNLA
jgi:hypothetical protein